MNLHSLWPEEGWSRKQKVLKQNSFKTIAFFSSVWVVQVKWKDKHKPELVVWLRNLALCASNSDGQGDLQWVFMLRQRGKPLSSVEDFV